MKIIENVLVPLLVAAIPTTLAFFFQQSANDAKKEIEHIEKRVEKLLDPIPIGTTISSTMSYERLCESLNESDQFNKEKSSWAPADGRDVNGSKFHNHMNKVRVPDMRGVFIRGFNEFYPDGSAIEVNTRQLDPLDVREYDQIQYDTFKSHKHDYDYIGSGQPTVYNPSSDGVKANQTTNSTGYQGGDETRPKNIAVYYYIKIN